MVRVPDEFLTQDLISVMLSIVSISRTDRLFSFLNPERVGGSFDSGVLRDDFALVGGFGRGGGVVAVGGGA